MLNSGLKQTLCSGIAWHRKEAVEGWMLGSLDRALWKQTHLKGSLGTVRSAYKDMVSFSTDLKTIKS